MSSFLSLYEDRRVIPYARALADRYRYLTMIGLPHLGDRADIPLEQLYVEPWLGGPVPSYAEESQLQQGQPALQAIQALPRCVVIGEAGSGKSTLIASLILGLCQRGGSWTQQQLGALLPLPVILRDLRLVQLPTEKRWDYLLDLVRPQLPGSPELWAALPDYLARGQCLVLVDGWDEVSVETRRWLRLALAELNEQAPQVRLLLTSRPLGWQEESWRSSRRSTNFAAQQSLFREEVDWLGLVREQEEPKAAPEAGLDLPELWIHPFRLGQIEAFVDRWYQLRVPEERQRKERIAGLLEALRPEGRLRQLARVPNLLALMCLIYKVYVHLPSGRAQLYDKIAEAYLESIPVAVRLEALRELPLAQKARWLGLIARHMQLERVKGKNEVRGTRIGRAEAERLLQQAGGAPDLVASFLDFAARRAGLLLPLTEEELGFSHLSFQEYFAAVQLVADLKAGFLNPGLAKQAVNDLKRLAQQQAGHETVVLVFELVGTEPGVADQLLKLLEKGKVLPTALLAELYYDEATGLSGGRREQIWKKMRKEIRKVVADHEWGLVPAWVRSMDGVFTPEEAAGVTSLHLAHTGMARIDWIVTFPAVQRLFLPEVALVDVAPVLSMPALELLELHVDVENLDRFEGCRVPFISLRSHAGDYGALGALVTMPELRSLIFESAINLDWQALERCAQLGYIGIWGDAGLDLAPLRRLPRLRQFGTDSSLPDLSAIASVTHLEKLLLFGPRSLKDLSPLIRLTYLWGLSFGPSGVADLSVLASISTLEEVTISESPITSLQPLAFLPRLRRVTIERCPITDFAGLDQRPGLEFSFLPPSEPTTKSA